MVEELRRNRVSQKPRVHWDEREPPAANARRELPGLASRYFGRGRELLAKAPEAGDLHRLRLETKRLRYTLELFRPCYGPGLEARLGELRAVQQMLGEINDYTEAGRLLAKEMVGSPERERVVRFLETRAEGKARAFRKHWAGVFDGPGRERWWTSYLARAARAPRHRT